MCMCMYMYMYMYGLGYSTELAMAGWAINRFLIGKKNIFLENNAWGHVICL